MKLLVKHIRPWTNLLVLNEPILNKLIIQLETVVDNDRTDPQQANNSVENNSWQWLARPSNEQWLTFLEYPQKS